MRKSVFQFCGSASSRWPKFDESAPFYTSMTNPPTFGQSSGAQSTSWIHTVTRSLMSSESKLSSANCFILCAAIVCCWKRYVWDWIIFTPLNQRGALKMHVNSPSFATKKNPHSSWIFKLHCLHGRILPDNSEYNSKKPSNLAADVAGDRRPGRRGRWLAAEVLGKILTVHVP